MRRPVIAIDGPAGSGKSTVAKLVAQRLGFLYIDTGAMYRALTVKALQTKTDLNDETKLGALARATDIKLEQSSGSLKVYPHTKNFSARVYLDGEDVTSEIRTPEITNKVKYIARAKPVRECMVAKQRKLGEEGGTVMEGRDIGTVVLPDADKKFYIDASFDVRVARRHKELNGNGAALTEEEVRKDLKIRDESDFNRAIGPLKKADDAIVVDTTDLTIEGVVDKVLSIIKAL
ncbi:MAG: (d)CMP kinase [Candidatus Omnitrophica bacterium]|nr:(d)CMP kinase [Candidatus Omnitrophota bacterium]MDD5311284.1 (d)CMP kinase [Candidatus Omnitrophota bacterium]MDD5546850.1 (d)CMP kinase [Candidatus Omnitrophota bacterium]